MAATIANPTPNRLRVTLDKLRNFRRIKESRRVDHTEATEPTGITPESLPAAPEQMVPAGSWTDYAYGAPGVTWVPRTTWDGGPPGRVPRLMYPGNTMLAGLRSVAGAALNGGVSADYMYLPPTRNIPQRGAGTRSVAGGKNRVSGSINAGMSHIPGVFVPLGLRVS